MASIHCLDFAAEFAFRISFLIILLSIYSYEILLTHYYLLAAAEFAELNNASLVTLSNNM